MRPKAPLVISYAGELGWELYGQIAIGDRACDLMWARAGAWAARAVGAVAFDSLRLEKGYRLWGQDITTERSLPIRCGTRKGALRA